MADVYVRIAAPDKEGRPRAQILVGSKAGKTFLQSELSEAIRERLQGLAPGQSVRCKSNADPMPSNIVVEALSTSSLKPATRTRGSAARSTSGAQAGTDRSGEQTPHAVPANAWDDYPFNFAAFAGKEPWLVEQPETAAHDTWAAGRVSGVVRIQFKAATPVFVSAGDLSESPTREVRHFCTMVDAQGTLRYAIPGSGLKGATRSLFEALTNARLGIVSTDNYGVIPFRRRSATAWVIAEVQANGDVVARRADVRFLRQGAPGWKQRSARGRDLESWSETAPEIVSRISGHHGGWQAIAYRANLLWTPAHTHRYTHLGVKLRNETAVIPAETVERYRAGLEHLTFGEHAARVADIRPSGPGKNFYRDVVREPLAQRRMELARLEPWVDVVFGIAARDGRRIHCFGKNVNFVWPSAKSPRDLIGRFWPRPEEEQSLKTADVAEATYGFAGRHTSHSHPFRSRIRPTVFWGPAVADTSEPPEIQLAALTSPTGVKLKSRIVYTPPAPDGRAQTYDESEHARGRIMYWPQRASGDTVSARHCKTYKEGEAGASQLPPPIAPLPTGTVFSGEVHFDNLAAAELGALLVTLMPDLLFKKAESTDVYGFLIGKGKPRGLGSLRAESLSLLVRSAAPKGYERLDDSPCHETPEAIRACVDAYTQWLDDRARQLKLPSYRDLPFIRDLARLLRLPIDRVVFKDYPTTPGDYGWMPAFDDADGNPTGGRGARPPAMRHARDI